jgi:hypothetical protein
MPGHTQSSLIKPNQTIFSNPGHSRRAIHPLPRPSASSSRFPPDLRLKITQKIPLQLHLIPLNFT